MTAALLGSMAGLTLGVALAALVRAGIATPAPRTGPVATWIATALDDHSWRDDQLRHAEEHAWLRESLAYLATAAPVHAGLFRRGAPQGPGIDIIARWWTPAPVMGRPPLTTRRVAGATLIGASA